MTLWSRSPQKIHATTIAVAMLAQVAASIAVVQSAPSTAVLHMLLEPPAVMAQGARAHNKTTRRSFRNDQEPEHSWFEPTMRFTDPCAIVNFRRTLTLRPPLFCLRISALQIKGQPLRLNMKILGLGPTAKIVCGKPVVKYGRWWCYMQTNTNDHNVHCPAVRRR